jgi:hypothetical protein
MHAATNLATTILTSAVTSLFAFWIQERKLRTELRTEFAAEAVVKRLLLSPDWRKRSFNEISRRLGEGFDDAELKKILVRAGAVCFTGKKGEELWGLIERNKDEIA